MTTTIDRDIRQRTGPARPALLAEKRRPSAGKVEQRLAGERSNPVAQGRASPIRAWRAAETDASQTPSAEARTAAKTPAGAFRQPSSRDTGAGARPGALERAARMRAIEQAWKEELARQAELETEEQRLAEAARGRRVAEAHGQPAS